MEWPRVKSVLIVMLAIVNIFLFAAYAHSEITNSREQEAVLEHTVSVLTKRGFSIDRDLIPEKSMVLYPARAERDTNWESVVARAILGEASRDRLGTTVNYKNDNGEISFRNNGYFEITLNGISQVTDKQSMRKYVHSLAEKLEINVGSDEIKVEEEAQSFRASVRQYILGVPIYNGRLSVWVLPDNSVKITGRLMSENLTVLRGEEPYEISGLLISLIEELKQQGIEGGRIERISPGYRMSSSADSSQVGVLYAIPVWNIQIDGIEHYISAMNGKTVYID